MKRMLMTILVLLSAVLSQPSEIAAADCTGVSGYVEEMKQVTSPFFDVLAKLPDFARMTESDLQELAEATDQLIESYETIIPPDIARDYHDAYIRDLHTTAEMLHNMATLGTFATLELMDSMPTPAGPSSDEYASLLAQRCEEFRPYVVWLNTYPDSPASPEASPAH